MDNFRLSQYSQRPSQSFVVNRSFISTTFTTEGTSEDLRKSKIMNLPNYKKLGLADNLPFVVIFQTIEIERLSNEIESNRIKIKDFERQIFNAQNYEVQIRELTEKCFAYEMEREKYQEQNEKLNLICHQLYTELEDMKRKYSEIDFSLKEKYEMERLRGTELLQEIERWKARYMAAEKSKAKELDDLRLMMESQRKSMLDREMRELTIKFQADRGNLENEIRKLRQSLEYKNRELDDMRQKVQRTDITIMELRSNLTQIPEFQSKITLMSQEMMRLNEVLRGKQEELENFRQREYQLQGKLKEQSQWQFDCKQLRSTLESRQREIEEWRIRCSKLEDGMQKAKELSAVNADLSSRLSMASNEIERMNGALRGKLEQMEQWKQRVASQQFELARYKNLQRDIESYENKIGMLTSEIERLNGQLKARLTELDDWRGKCSKLQVSINTYVMYERENKDLQDRLNLQTRAGEEAKHRVSRLESEISSLRLQERKLEETQKRSAMLNSELDRLNGLLRNKQQEVEDYKTRHSRLEQSIVEYRTIETKLRDYEGKVAMLTQEIERLTNLLRAKNDEVERMNSNYKRLEEEVIYLKSHEIKLAESDRTIKSLNATLDGLRKELSRWQDKYKSLDMRAKELDSSCFSLTQDKDKLTSMLRSKTSELEDFRIRTNRLEQESYRTREIEASYHDAQVLINQFQNRLNMFTVELERLEKAHSIVEVELERERTLSTELAFKVIILSSQVERSSGSSGIKSKDFLEMQERHYQLQSASREKDSQILIITQKMASLQTKINFLGGELERYLQIINQNQRHARQLEQEITQFQDYAKRIKILSTEIDRLTGENKGLEDDIRKLRLRYADQISAETKHEAICMSFVIMAAQVESLRARVSEKEMQFQEMRKSILEPVRNLK